MSKVSEAAAVNPLALQCQFCPPSCGDCLGPGKCECFELVDGHGGGPLSSSRKPTVEEAEAILTLVRGGWLKLELTLDERP